MIQASEHTRGPVSANMSDLVLVPSRAYTRGRRVWRLFADFKFEVEFPGGRLEITVPDGFKTDLASIPVVFTPFIGTPDRYATSAVVHDWACVNNFPQWFANSLLRTVMEFDGVPKWRQIAVFWAVQLCGYKSWLFGRRVRRKVEGVQNEG